MLLLRDYIWAVTNRLVKDFGFSLLNTTQHGQAIEDLPEMHLIKNIRSTYIYIRLAPMSFLWPNQVKHDIIEAKQRAKSILLQSGGNKIKFLNLYLFQEVPTKEVHEIIVKETPFVEKKLEGYIGYIDLENGKIGISENTFDELNLNTELFVYYLSHPINIEPQQIYEEVKRVEIKRENELKSIFNYGKPSLTYLFIAINALLFILMTLNGGSTNHEVLLDFGAKESYLIAHGEYWRLLTSMFLHIGFLHFALNNMALYYLGLTTEKIFGSTRFFMIYILSGLIGSIGSFLFNPSVISAGASGAIYGLFGALLYFGYIYPDLFFRTMGKDILTIIGINIVFSFAIPSIDVYAHLGGLLGGFFIAAIVRLPRQGKIKWLVTITASLMIIVTVGAAWWGINVREVKGSEVIFYEGQKALQKEDNERAYEIFGHLVKQYPNNYNYHFYFANIVLKNGDFELAKYHYNKALTINPELTEAYYNLALIALFTKNNYEAIENLNKALEINPNFKQAEELLNDLR